MADPKLKIAVDGMNAPKLREILNKLCEHGTFAIEDPTGKIEIDGRNIIISKGFVDLTQSDDSDVDGEQNNNGGVEVPNINDGKVDNENDSCGGVEIVDPTK
ncbi:hypothetical protein OCU04_001029 [Sclerotinia nivalis]|uniref:Uncharacterized protein n=1 Tax=Sclerotinia nivalis TaxID=352851 RepID=A0A9X0AYG1_9HELO|nr:hypothetical protein OCU04_001029 [Sclerotinia nivalis]